MKTKTSPRRSTKPSLSEPKVQRILATTDFSPCSEAGVRYAVDLARTFDAQLLLLHVIEPTEAGWLIPTDDRKHRGKLRQVAEHKLAKLIHRTVPCEVRTRAYVRAGRAWQTITEFALRTQADMIVLASHGRTGVKHVLLRSVPERDVHARL